MVLGFMPDVTYTSTVVPDFAAGDRVVFYTDGITEAARADGDFYGDRRFREAVLDGLAQPADAFTASLVADARRWVDADFGDDVTKQVLHADFIALGPGAGAQTRAGLVDEARTLGGGI